MRLLRYEQDIRLPRNDVYDRAFTRPEDEDDGSLRSIRTQCARLLKAEGSFYKRLHDRQSNYREDISILSHTSAVAFATFE